MFSGIRNNYSVIDTYRQWEKCRDKLATLTCLAWGLGEDYYYWYDWDQKLHQAVYKQSHKRFVIKEIIGKKVNGGYVTLQGDIIQGIGKYTYQIFSWY